MNPGQHHNEELRLQLTREQLNLLAEETVRSGCDSIEQFVSLIVSALQAARQADGAVATPPVAAGGGGDVGGGGAVRDIVQRLLQSRG